MKKITFILLVLLAFSISWNITAQITSYPYQEDFESGDGGWVADNTTNGTWALGTPVGAIINSADSGTNAWVTNLSGNYNSSENSWVTSPVFDLSSLTSPSIELSIWYDIEFSWDGAVMQSSIDSGASWQNVGALGDGNNWYTDDTIAGNPGGQQEGWSGTGTAGTNAWVIARHALIGLGGQSNVILRIAFGSDGSVTDEGFGFDSVNIFEVVCSEPTGLTVGGITATTADVSWTSGGSETAWEVVVQPIGTGVPTGSGDPTTNPYAATGLTAVTDYEVYVRANCLTDGYSNWVGPVNFLSACDVFIPDYIEDFTTIIPNCWDEADNGDATTGPMDLGAGSWTADGFLNNGFNGAYKINLYLAAKSDWILSPQFDLTGGPFQVDFDFGIMQWGSSTNAGTLGSDDTVELLISTDNGATWTNLVTFDNTSAVPVTGTQVVYDLTAYSGQIVQFGILGSEGTVDDAEDNDIFVDNFRVRAIPDCPEPTGLTVSNITGTTVDVSWTMGASETDWQYVVQPAGTGVPTGDGTDITTTTVNYTGLDYSTDYEVYVRANCGGASGYSTWVGPVDFSTTILLNYTVDCNAGPLTQDFCYFDDIDDDPSVATFTFTSSDGTPLNLTFNSGQVEDCCDELVVLDSDGTELLNDSVGDVSGLTFQSTGDTISFYVNSDFSVSCESGSFPEGINYTVACATCINPTANYIVVDDCENGDQFLIDVDVTSIGDAVSLTISDNMGSTPVQVMEAGITQFGPYPFLTDIIITIENDDDANCIINSSAIQQAACPPDNDNPCDATIAVVNDDESCDLLTPGTIIAASDSGVPVGTCGGDPDDDVWFEFVALNEVQLISLVNIQGSTTNLDHAVYEGVCDNLVELYCSADAASVTTMLTIGNTYFVRVFSAFSNEETSTFDLCIKEAPDNINCENASNFCSDGDALYGSNVIGIPNSTDVACLGSIPNPSWNTIQIGESGPVNIQIEQNTEFDADGNPIGTGLDVDFVLWGPFDSDTDFCELDLLVDCPTCPNNTSPGGSDFYPFDIIVDCSYDPADIETVTIENAIAGEIYVLLVTNFSNNPGIIQIQQTNAGETGAGAITADIEVDLGTDQDLCGFPDYTIVADSPYADTYEWYQNGINMADETGDSITVTESDTYTVIVYNDQCDVSAQDEVVINFYQDANANPVEDMVTCDDASADEIEDFDLETQTPIVLGSQLASDFAVTYYLSLSDAQLAVGALSSPYNNVSNPQTIFIRIEDVNAVGSGSGCFVTTSFELIISGPLPTATSVDMTLCDDFSRDEIESFDLDSNSSNILDGQSDTMFTVSYYLTEADAEAGLSPLASPYENVSNPQTVYARVENNDAFDCYKTTAFNLIVNDVPFTTFETDIVYEVCPNATIPIEVIAIANNYSESDVTINWYQDDVLISGENSLLLPVLTEGTYTIETNFNTTGCVYEADILVTELETCVIPQAISPNSDGFNDEFDLSSYDVHRLEIYNRNGKLVYSKDNYSHEWVGQTDEGDLLPVGTYFYVMRYQDDKEKRAWIYLNY